VKAEAVIDKDLTAAVLADTGVLGGIISGAIAAYMFNRFYRIKLPEYLGFFAGKRFVPIISGLARRAKIEQGVSAVGHETDADL
jgi:phosphotransferase system  glucose/maltose/N-acetylglucosamine-specific IIC component